MPPFPLFVWPGPVQFFAQPPDHCPVASCKRVWGRVQDHSAADTRLWRHLIYTFPAHSEFEALNDAFEDSQGGTSGHMDWNRWYLDSVWKS